jgi:hypothetical protein
MTNPGYYAALYGHDHPRATTPPPGGGSWPEVGGGTVSRNMQPKQFFHGTSQEIKGDVIKPSNAHGISNYDYDQDFKSDAAQRKASVFSVDEEKAAWGWARSTSPEMRPRVHEVKPVGQVMHDEAGSHLMTGTDTAFMSPRAKIVDTHWIPPPSPGTHRASGPVQGTLPPLNWAQHVDWDHHTAPEYKSDAHSLPMEEHVRRDRMVRKTEADFQVEEDERSRKIMGARARQAHPKLF